MPSEDLLGARERSLLPSGYQIERCPKRGLGAPRNGSIVGGNLSGLTRGTTEVLPAFLTHPHAAGTDPGTRTMRPLWLLLCLVSSGLVISPTHAQARGRGNASRYMQAQRQAEINKLQQQWSQDKELLDKLRSQAGASEGELNQARQRAASAREDVNQANTQHHQAHAKLHEIEKKILEKQGDDSELGKAFDALEAAQHALDREMHRILKWPVPAADEEESQRVKELGSLSAEQRKQLSEDTSYGKQKDALTEASDSVARIRHKLFESDSEWKKAKQDCEAAAEAQGKADKGVGEAASGSRGARTELRSTTQVAAALQQSMNQIEMRLRSLGAAPKMTNTANTGTKKK